jgi:hypothetical protein
MLNAASRQLPLSDQVSITWWRLVIFATRHLHRAKIRFYPVYAPIRPYLWVPLLALGLGMVLGWLIALA